MDSNGSILILDKVDWSGCSGLREKRVEGRPRRRQAEVDRSRKASALRSNQRSYFIHSQKMQAIVCLQSEPIIQLIGFYFSNEG